MLATNIKTAKISTAIQGEVRRPVSRRLRPFMRMSRMLGMVAVSTSPRGGGAAAY